METTNSSQLITLTILLVVLFCSYTFLTSKRRVRAKIKNCRVQRKNITRDLHLLKEVSVFDSYKADYKTALLTMQSIPYKRLSYIDKLSHEPLHSFTEIALFFWFDIQISWFVTPKFHRIQSKLRNIFTRIERLMNQLEAAEKQLTGIANLTDEPVIINCRQVLETYRLRQPYPLDLIVKAEQVKEELEKNFRELDRKIKDIQELAESIPVYDAETKATVWFCLKDLAASIKQKSITVKGKLRDIKICTKIEDVNSNIAETQVFVDNTQNEYSSLCEIFNHCEGLIAKIQEIKEGLEKEDWQKHTEIAKIRFQSIEDDIERAKQANSFQETCNVLNELRGELKKILDNLLTRQEVTVDASKTTTTTITGGVFGFQNSGSDADIHDNIIQASASEASREKVDLTKLVEDLARLSQELQKRATEPEHFAAIANVGYATKEAKQGNKQKVLEYLSKVGSWVLRTAEEISAKVAVQMITEALKK